MRTTHPSSSGIRANLSIALWASATSPVALAVQQRLRQKLGAPSGSRESSPVEHVVQGSSHHLQGTIALTAPRRFLRDSHVGARHHVQTRTLAQPRVALLCDHLESAAAVCRCLPLHQRQTERPPDHVAGHIACGTYDDNPDVTWTKDADLLLADAQGPNLEELHKWWNDFG